MISIDYEISENILRKVNKNIYLIIELFNKSCKDLDYETFLVEIFPEFLCRKNKEKCIEVLKELEEYTRDDYYHNLKPIQEYALFNLLGWWLEVTDCDFEETIEENDIKSLDDRYIAKNINNIEAYKGFMFEDWDFLDDSLSDYIELCKKNPEFVQKFFHIDLEEYLELMPDDIKEEYFNAKNKSKISLKKEDNIEELIVKLIYNATKYKENDPRRLMNTSETQLSDDVTAIIKEKLHDNGIIVTREMTSGFAKKGIGECDFYIYTYKDNIFKVVAIGENKEWGNFEKQLKQLLGYMNSDTMFGFTILFNKNINLGTALKKRKQILEDLYVEIDGVKNFEVVGEIEEVEGMSNVLMTLHKNPEKENSYFRIYHFVVNAKLDERQESALQARK
ncbi:hypothetical protein [Clostridium saccharobutylicum]|uniref:Uncharacterized protein n=1 Tax=Clostridium saccharobutylicum TaxID=169679 RepID=A0A1S8MND1_CLOSA|nr:hypothetical protein [Clostridium saccharobutylicum]OOM05684.1 hypothetical protein CLOSAC_45530 [Clostridium saccharobutylicum]